MSLVASLPLSASSQGLLESGLKRLPAKLHDEVHGQLESLAEALSAADTRTLESADARNWLGSLPRVWACSKFVATWCIRDPGAMLDLVASGDLVHCYGDRELKTHVANAVAGCTDPTGLDTALRRCRKREAVRIAWRQLAGWSDLAELMASTSDLAEACIETTLDHHYRWMTDAFGAPLGESSAQPIALSILGLGKLGGRELNFSSDVDLIFTYSEDGATSGGRYSNHEFFTRLGRRVIATLDAPTADGFVFRTDMRLRPNGDSGPLALSFDAMEHYYQFHGRDWERYALIKARPVAGDHAAGYRLLQSLKPFVYRKYLDFGAFEAIRAMKVLIEQQFPSDGLGNDVKLGRGGIREVEFIAQSYQLIRGGREPKLQTPRLYDALAEVTETGMLSESVVEQLKSGYDFLRDTEHCLQMLDDRQTHRLPVTEIDQTRLAFRFGFENWDAYYFELSKHTDRIHEQFNRTFATASAAKPEHSVAMDIWLGASEPAMRAGQLRELGYTRPEEAAGLLAQLRAGSVYRALSHTGRDRLDHLMPLIIEATLSVDNNADTLTRIVNVVQSIGRRSAYLALLIENPLALTQLVKLCSASAWLSTWVAQHPVLLDELLDPLSGYRPTTVTTMTQEIESALATVDSSDLEEQMERMRDAHHARVLQIAAADCAQNLDAWQVSIELSDLAEAVLVNSVDIAKRSFADRYGSPSCGRSEKPVGPDFGVVAYGKLGSLELGYNSDLDLVFLYEICGTRPGAGDKTHGGGVTLGGHESISNEHYFGRLTQRIIHILTTRTAAGFLYEIDMRLRPSGRSGTLVSSVDAFASYQRTHAWTWEHQALVRSRMVTGHRELRERFEQIRERILRRERDAATLKEAIVAMRQKMLTADVRTEPRYDSAAFDLKLDRGGIVDIEFFVQYLVLQYAHSHPELTGPRDNIGLLALAADLHVVDHSTAASLAQAYRSLLQRGNQLKLMDAALRVPDTELTDVRDAVKQAWNRVFG